MAPHRPDDLRKDVLSTRQRLRLRVEARSREHLGQTAESEAMPESDPKVIVHAIVQGDVESTHLRERGTAEERGRLTDETFVR